jgi:hypothetical protein
VPRRLLLLILLAALAGIAWVASGALVSELPRSALGPEWTAGIETQRDDARLSSDPFASAVATEPEGELAAVSTARAAVPTESSARPESARVLRGRLLAPAGLPLPGGTAVVIVDDTPNGWMNYLHQRTEQRERLPVDASGRFEFRWNGPGTSRTVFADAATLGDCALAQLTETEDGGVGLAPVEYFGSGAEWFNPSPTTALPLDGEREFVLQTHAAATLGGRLLDTPPAVLSALELDPATIAVRAASAPNLALKATTWPGQEFRIEHVPVGRVVSVTIEGLRLANDRAIELELRPGEHRELGVIGEHRYPLRGRVLDALGAPAVRAAVHATLAAAADTPNFLGRSQTDENGVFQLEGLPWRPFSLYAAAPHSRQRGWGAQARYEFTPSQALFEREVVLRLPELVRLAGQVLLPDGEPAALARVSASARAGADANGQWLVSAALETHTDAEGFFDLHGALARVHDLRAWWDPPQDGQPNFVARVDVEAPSDALVIRLAPIAALRGRVLQSDGTPWSGEWRLHTSTDDIDWWGSLLHGSAFAHRKLWPGRWWIYARNSAGAQSVKFEVDVPADLAREHVLVLQDAAVER